MSLIFFARNKKNVSKGITVKMRDNILTIILAAGKGTRMKSLVPKVLHKLGGYPILGHVLNTVEKIKSNHNLLLLSPDTPDIEHYARRHPLSLDIVYQDEQKGTGHAVLCAKSYLRDFKGIVLILFGDTPLIRPETLKTMLEKFSSFSPRISAMVVGMIPSNPKNYGRLILDEAENVIDIIEAKGASAKILDIPLCNSGVMLLDGCYALSMLQSIQENAESGEYYLTDVVSIARQQGHRVGFYRAEDPNELEGINSRSELAWAEAQLQYRWRTAAMEEGVTLIDPQSIYFSYDTQLSGDVTVYPHVFFGAGVTVESGVEIMPFTHLEGVAVKARAKIGPYARLRPGTIVGEESRIGNFVEMKNTVFGRGAKAGHLSYIGDAEVGEATNIGAGTITCNYDGYHKWPTKIGHHVLVGANSSLVAPLTIGSYAIIGAGSTVTKDVAEEALAVGRSRQMDITDGGKAFHERKKNRNTHTKKDSA